jgi:hypothetical protein
MPAIIMSETMTAGTITASIASAASLLGAIFTAKPFRVRALSMGAIEPGYRQQQDERKFPGARLYIGNRRRHNGSRSQTSCARNQRRTPWVGNQ